MKKRLSICIICILGWLSFSAFTEDDPISALLKKLEEFTKKYPQEKVYLHLDKPYYAIGDDIWFKAYVVDAKTAEPSILSKILYVELIDDRDSIVKKVKLLMDKGIAAADFPLTDSLSEGNYRIRAYTQYMRNAGPAFFFDKTIKLGNSWANQVFIKANSNIITDGKTQAVSTTLLLTNKVGVPYGNTKVDYEVELDNRNISKGRTITNAQGEAILKYVNNMPSVYKSGKITATITIANNKKVVKFIPIKSTSPAIDVQFFPEGGTLIEGLSSKVATKAIDANGLGQNVSGKIIDNEGVEVLNFETHYLGMGSFILNSVPGKTYSAVIKLANGDEKTFPMPKPIAKGYVMSVNNIDTSKITVKVFISNDLLNKGELSLVGQHNGNVYFSTKIPTEKQMTSISIAKKEFLSGIVQLTLFSPEKIPVCERLAFINNKIDKIDLNFQDLNPSYGKRGNVSATLTSTNMGKPIQGSFSISVTNTAAVTPDLNNESNILTSLLLTSDLVGYVEKPNHYFLTDDIKTRSELDNLLLTQGWRKINWQSITNEQFPAITYEPEKTMKISGTITKYGKPVANAKINIVANSKAFFSIDTVSDNNGRFSLNDISYGDSVKFIIQAKTIKDKNNVEIKLDEEPGQIVTPNKNTGDIEVNVNESMMTYINQSDEYFNEKVKRGLLNHTILLNEVRVKEKISPFANSFNLNGGGNADYVITAKDLEKAITLSQYMQGHFPAIRIKDQKAYSLRGPTPALMAIVLNGQFVSDFTLDDIPITDIESVEILRSKAKLVIYGNRGGSGMVHITTKKGPKLQEPEPSPGIVNYSPKGIYVNRDFYSPKYTAVADPKPDLRSTVYWNPHLVTDQTGRVNLNYFNTDQAGTYRIVIEGIDAFGNLARKVYTYQVN